jgi:hypothetical protein
MRLLRLSEVEPSSEARLFRSSVSRALVLALFLSGVGATVVLADWVGRTRSAYYIAYYVAAVILLGMLFLHRFVLARVRSSNWLAQLRNDGVFVQFRSYLNYRLPTEDLTVVFIAYNEIRSARLVRESSKLQNEDGVSKHTRRLIELELAGDIAPFSKALAAELARSAPRENTWYGYTSTLYKHYPVRMDTPPFLQLEWRVAPGATAFLNALRPYTMIAPPVVVSEDFAQLGNLGREEQEMGLRELDLRGQTFAAVHLARRLYGYDLKQAQNFVEGLRNKL